MKGILKVRFLILAAVTLHTLGGCSSAPVDENNPAALMKDAEGDISSEHYQIAVDKLRVIKNKFPYSKYALEAQLRIADVYYLQESFAEAAGTYEAFYDLHPKHDKAAYAMYRAAKSYYADSPRIIARDLTPAQKALDAYNEFKRRFPHAPEMKEASQDISEIRTLLADKELYIGKFYYTRDFYNSAKPRFKKIIELYPETTTAQEAEDYLAKLDLKTRKEDLPNHERSDNHE